MERRIMLVRVLGVAAAFVLVSGIASGYQHIQKSISIDDMRGERIFHRSLNRSECCLVQYEVNSLTCIPAIFCVPDITLNEFVM